MADDRLPCCRWVSIAATNSDNVMWRSPPISFRLFQNASSRLTLVLWPRTTIERLATGDFIKTHLPSVRNSQHPNTKFVPFCGHLKPGFAVCAGISESWELSGASLWAYASRFGFRDFVLSRPQTAGGWGVETPAASQCASEAKFDPRICSIWPPSGHLFMFTRGSHWWMCAHAGRRTEDQTWHFAKRVTATSQRRRKWRRKSANLCAATS